MTYPVFITQYTLQYSLYVPETYMPMKRTSKDRNIKNSTFIVYEFIMFCCTYIFHLTQGV